jgi:hypothetical protein
MVLLLLLSTALVVSASSKRDDLANAGAVSPAIPVQTQTVEESQTTPLGALNRFSSFVVLALSVILIVRLTFDESLTRRPRLEQNLNQAGLTFLFFPAFTILMTGVFLKDPPVRNIDSVKSGVALLQGHESSDVTAAGDQATPPATETIIAAGAAKVAELSGQVDSVENRDASGRTSTEEMIARILVVVAHTTVVVGLMYIGRKHFCSAQLGVSMCCLYLLLPCTAFNVHELSHVVPGACLTWAFAMYRKPAVAGVLLGLACGTLFFAVFLLPLWAVFYGRKGSLRFGISLGAVAAVVLMTFALTSATTDSFVSKLVMTANWTAYRLFDAATPMSESAIGHVFLRIILAALFFVMFVAMTVIPRKRNLENLLANSTALIVAAQLWYPEDVGSYVLWYLPLLMLVMFRPRLDRFVPPEADHSHTMQRPSDQQTQQGAGTLSRVTLYH